MPNLPRGMSAYASACGNPQPPFSACRALGAFFPLVSPAGTPFLRRWAREESPRIKRVLLFSGQSTRRSAAQTFSVRLATVAN